MGMHCGFAQGMVVGRVDGAKFGRLGGEGGGAGSIGRVLGDVEVADESNR